METQLIKFFRRFFWGSELSKERDKSPEEMFADCLRKDPRLKEKIIRRYRQCLVEGRQINVPDRLVSRYERALIKIADEFSVTREEIEKELDDDEWWERRRNQDKGKPWCAIWNDCPNA